MDRSPTDPAPPTRLRGSWILRQILGRALLPHHVVRWVRRRRTHRRVSTVHANAQLLLYNRMLPGDFLHYGYFDDPETPPDTISFDAIQRAQLRYAEIAAGAGSTAPARPSLTRAPAWAECWPFSGKPATKSPD